MHSAPSENRALHTLWKAVLILALLVGTALLAPFRMGSLRAQETAGGNTKFVPAGSNLQGILNEAALGDTLVVEAGATYTGNFVLRAKEGEGVITIISSAHNSLPPDDTRVSPEHAVSMAKLVTPNSLPVVWAEDGAHDYRFVGIEFHPAPGIYISDLILLGSPSSREVEQLPYNLEFDRVYVHGDPNRGGKRGIALNSRSTIIKNSYFTDFKSDFQDAQDITGWNGPGPDLILNNRLEASGMSVMFGGAAPAIRYLVPADIFFYNNYITRPMSWRGRWPVKNLFELKNARNVDVRFNVFENNWVSAQNGIAILFTVRTCEAGDYPWAVVKDVTFSHNVVRNSEGGAFNILGRDASRDTCNTAATGTITTRGTQVSGYGTRLTSELEVGQRIVVNKVARTIKGILSDQSLVIDSPFPEDIITPAAFAYNVPVAGQTSNIAIRDNLLEAIRPFDGSRDGTLFLILSGAQSIVIEHNTGFQGQSIVVADGGATAGLVFRSNISPHNTYGIFGSDKGVGKLAIDFYFPGSTITHNVIAGAGDNARSYPSGNFFPASLGEVGFVDLAGRNYALSPASPYKGAGSDGKDPGANMAIIEQVLRDAIAGTLTPGMLAQSAARRSLQAMRKASSTYRRASR